MDEDLPMNKDFGVAYKHPRKDMHIKITLNEFKDQVYVHIREYGLDGDTNTFYPTKSGYAILAEELDTVIALLNQASDYLGDTFKHGSQYNLELEEKHVK